MSMPNSEIIRKMVLLGSYRSQNLASTVLYVMKWVLGNQFKLFQQSKLHTQRNKIRNLNQNL